MQVLISGTTYNLNASMFGGGEGLIYSLGPHSAAKIYHKNVVSRERRLKVLALCNNYANSAMYGENDSYAFPNYPAYEIREELDLLCGFSMQFFRDCPTLGDLGYDLSSKSFKSANGIMFDDDKAEKFIYDVFDAVDRLHKVRVILGDVNPLNLMYNIKTHLPIIIDLDSAQVGQFRCLSWSPEYLDPLIQQQGKNPQGGYTYSFESDIFSIACVCFKFFVGMNPFFVYTDPNNGLMHNKENNISLLRYTHNNTDDLNGVRYLSSNQVNKNIKDRILVLKTNYPKLYDFFLTIFLDSHRISLMNTLDRSDPRNPAYIFFSQSGFNKILQTIIARKKQAKIAQAVPSIPTAANTFTIPDAGFPKAIPSYGVTQTKVAQTVPTSQTVIGTFAIPDAGFSKVFSSSSVVQTTTTKITDPDQLLKFLNNYLDDKSIFNGVI